MELRDDTKTTFIEAIGFTTYSTSKAGVLSYVSIFENLWIQSDLFEQLKRHDKMQRDFINIAPHELRTPIQPILGLTDIVRSHMQEIPNKQNYWISLAETQRDAATHGRYTGCNKN